NSESTTARYRSTNGARSRGPAPAPAHHQASGGREPNDPSGLVRDHGDMLPLVDRGGHDAIALPEYPAEVRGAREAPGERDVGDGLAGMRLQFLAAMLQPGAPDVIAHRHAAFAEQHVQIALGAAERRRDAVDGEIGIA